MLISSEISVYSTTLGLQSEEPLRKLWELHFLDELVDIPAELQEKVPAETQYLWKTEWEKKQKRARFAGAAAEVDALREKDRVRQAEGLAALVRRWKSEYQRSQG